MEITPALSPEIRADLQIRAAVAMLAHSFDSTRPARFIRGVAISTSRKINGTNLHARGVIWTPGSPLLADHDWDQPVGKIEAIDVSGDVLTFTARIANKSRFDPMWEHVKSQGYRMASILAEALTPGQFGSWMLNEISLCRQGADPGARLQRCWESLPYLPLDGARETVHWTLGMPTTQAAAAPSAHTALQRVKAEHERDRDAHRAKMRAKGFMLNERGDWTWPHNSPDPRNPHGFWEGR